METRVGTFPHYFSGTSEILVETCEKLTDHSLISEGICTFLKSSVA
ncbi:MAG: hypothetical protein CSYNP_03147 [Syntrophus sp. SKADARSKE-3]|nr:hypothetical protein [Syntrophus sp. SKADARSKE-3]